ncbi:hypothetical protein MAR_006442 [Mya arenaria]|uniref:Uncharacterized protein n=1 Tax=Mya arenaria TaxID=6604 RepID=A0ABY7DA57_MYAAR|nr:uncharacterized protein LOC128207928 [Mya arenaria]WAQ93971.1 hypothetical protein MAR_006442 [Mya arenaria]
MSSSLTLQSGQSVPSRLSRHSVKIRHYSSFPNLLSIYEAPKEEGNSDDDDEGNQERRERRKGHRRGKKRNEQGNSDDAIDIRQRVEMRQLRMDSVAREQLERFDKYVERMCSKVERQREERRKYNEALQERLREQEEAEKKKLRLHRGPKHKYVNDTSFLKALPVSNHCKATRLADELQRKGVLRTRQDVEKYWAGYGNSPRNNADIFSQSTNDSVLNHQNWMGQRNPDIRVTSEDDEVKYDGINKKTTLPPISRKKKR